MRAGWTGIWGGSRAQAPSLLAADSLTSDGKGVYFTYTLLGMSLSLKVTLAGIIRILSIIPASAGKFRLIKMPVLMP